MQKYARIKTHMRNNSASEYMVHADGLNHGKRTRILWSGLIKVIPVVTVFYSSFMHIFKDYVHR